MHLQTRPCSACVHFHEAPLYIKVFFTTTNHTNSSQYSLPRHSVPKSAFQLTNPTGIKRRYYQHAGVFNACIDLRLTRTQKKKNCRGQLESRSLTKIYLPRAICITRSFSSWLSFNMVVRTGTKCSLSFGRHFRNCNMTFLRYSRFACSFSRSWFLSSLKKYIHDSRFSFQEPWLLLNCANKVDYMANEGRENEVNNFPVNV